jgi:hypothetical protein
MALIETWFVKNIYVSNIDLIDIMVPTTLIPGAVAKDLIAIGNTAESIASSSILRNATEHGLVESDYFHSHDEFSLTSHTHSGLSILTGGPLSDADTLHTHDSLTDEIEVNSLINTAITNIDLSDYVTKAGSINQLSDIFSEGAVIEDAVSKAHDEAHTLLEHLDDGLVTTAKLTLLMDGSNADCCHTHSFQVHNNLTGLDGGEAGAYYHLTLNQHDTLTDGSNADALHIHAGGGGTFDGVHNDLDGLQGGDISNDEMYHLTFDQTDLVSRLGEDSAGLTFDGESIGTGGGGSGGTSIHNDLIGLQGGDVDADEFYHLSYFEFAALTGGPSSFADDLHNHSFPTTAYELPLGQTCDEGWDGGLFAWDEDYLTSCALDDINEVLGSLAPAPAPTLDDISVDNASGVSEDLSFGATQGITGYTNCNDVAVAPVVDINGTFTNSGKREGIVNATTDMSGILASDVTEGDGSPTAAYPAQSFGDADQGTLILELNGVPFDGTGSLPDRTIDLSISAADDTTAGGTQSGLDVIIATSVKFPSGASFDQFKYRTGTYNIDTDDMRSGWNYARVNHKIGSNNNYTNYVDWVVDAITTISDPTVFSLEALDTYSPSASKHLSGVEYDTAATALYDITITNAYLNTYVTSTTAVTFNETALNGVSNENLANVPIGGDKENATHVITDKTVTVDTSNRRLINQSVSLSTRLNRTVQTDSNSSGDSITGILFDNYNTSATEAGVEDFIAETYRMRSDSDFTSTTFASNWDETEFIYDAEVTAGYNDGLQVTNDILDYPTVDYRNTGDGGSITEGRSGNPDYSGGACTGTRYYYRYFKNTATSTGVFTMNFNGSGTFVPEDEVVFSGNDIKVSIRLPGLTAWMDCYKDFVTNQWADGNGCRKSDGRDFDNWLLDVGSKNTANSGDGIYIRITVPVNWTGNISHLTMAFS